MAKNSGPVRTVHARTTGKERDEMIATTKAEIEKKFGQGSIMRYGDGGPELEVEAIPTGALALDAALGIGGVPRGRIVEIYGPESSGKTTLSLEILAEAQAMGGVVAFIDAEHALDPTYAARIGVDIDEVLISQPDTGEQALEIVDMLVRSGAIDAIVVDSVAALTPRAEIEGEIGDTTVGLQARLMSQALRKLAGSLAKSKTTCIFINQLREKIGVMFGNPETTTAAAPSSSSRRCASIFAASTASSSRTRSSAIVCVPRSLRTRWPLRSALPSLTSCTARASLRKARFWTWPSSAVSAKRWALGLLTVRTSSVMVARPLRPSCANTPIVLTRSSIRSALPAGLSLMTMLRPRSS